MVVLLLSDDSCRVHREKKVITLKKTTFKTKCWHAHKLHTHTNTWHSIGLPLHLKHNSTTTNLLKNKRENKKTQSHNPVYRLSRPCAGPHSWLNDDNRNNYTHTHTMLGCRRHRHRRQPIQCGWGSKWQHGLLLSKQQKPVNTADSLNTEGQCETTKQPVSTIPHSPHRSHASTHTRPPRKAHRRYRERHQTRLHTRATTRVSALELRGDRTRSKEMRLRVREGRGGEEGWVPLFHLLDYGWQ